VVNRNVLKLQSRLKTQNRQELITEITTKLALSKDIARSEIHATWKRKTITANIRTMGAAMSDWKDAEISVVNALRYRGVACHHVGDYKSQWDVATDDGDQHIEVKYAGNNGRGLDSRWNVNVHRHNDLNEDGVDWYVVVLEGITRFNTFVILPTPLRRPTLVFSLRSLLNKHSGDVGNWEPIIAEERRRRQ
jgi:hypothetical protein